MQLDSDQDVSPSARRSVALNRKLGVLWCRFWALVIGAAGIALVAWYFTSAEKMATGSTLFITTVGVLLLAVSRHLWRNEDGLTEVLGGAEGPVQDSRRDSD